MFCCRKPKQRMLAHYSAWHYSVILVKPLQLISSWHFPFFYVWIYTAWQYYVRVCCRQLIMLSKSVSCILVCGIKSAQTVQSCTECVHFWWMWSQLIFSLLPEVIVWHNWLKIHRTVSMQSQKQTMQCQPYSNSVQGQEVVSSLAPHQQLTIYMFTEEAAVCIYVRVCYRNDL